MIEKSWAEKATRIVEAVYNDFLNQVIKKGVLNNRCTSEDQYGRELSDKEKKLITDGKMYDPRLIRLMSISGKGGWHKEPEKQQRYAKNYNVTLLEHLLSVTRGSLMLASLDWLSRNPEMDESLIRRKLSVMAAVAFMHDIDKDLCIPRITDVSTVTNKQIKERMIRYGIDTFLKRGDVKLEADQLLYLIDKVEALQANRRLPKLLPPLMFDGTLPLYIRLADKLEGIWLDDDPQKKTEEKGFLGVLHRLKTDKSSIRNDFLHHLFDELETESPIIDVFDPHHPFLLDELQRRLSKFCKDETGAPPLFEIHHDGRLVMLMLANQQQLASMKQEAIKDLVASLGDEVFQLKLKVNTRGEPELLNRQPGYLQLSQFLYEHNYDKDFQKLFLIKTSYQKALLEPLDALLDDFGLNPIFPNKTTGKTTTLYASLENLTEKAKRHLKKAAHAILLLNLLLSESKPRDGIPHYNDRETAFLGCIPEQTPDDWIMDIPDGHSRRVLIALWAITIAAHDKKVDNAIWGTQGLLERWFEGSEYFNGFRQFIKAEGDIIIQAVEHYLQQLFSGQYITVQDESAQGRCLFTDQPVDFKKRLEDNMGLKKVGIKASAFSGRDARPESIDFAKAHTNISPISLAEYQLRVQIHSGKHNADKVQTVRDLDNAATLIYSPATMGLFGGLAMDIDQDMQTLSLRDLSEFEIKSTHIIGIEHYTARYRITRFEYLPGKMAEQVNQLHQFLKATQRLGRPIHIFRGLPTANRAFFYYDAMPSLLAELLSDGTGNKNELRLEQIPAAIRRLELAKCLLETWGYGYNALQLYANPKTRFRSICFAWCGFYEKQGWIANRLALEYQSYFKEGELKMTANVTEKDGVMVKLGRVAAKIQAYPHKGFQASKTEQTMVFDQCFAVLSEGLRIPKSQIDRLSLINGIAERLEIMLARRHNVLASNEHRPQMTFQEACVEVSTLFVDQFWIEVMGRRYPSQDNMRFLKSVYRMSFMRRSKKTDNAETQD